VDASTALTVRARLGATRSELLADADAWAKLLTGERSAAPDQTTARRGKKGTTKGPPA
jgi:hypothetical protein